MNLDEDAFKRIHNSNKGLACERHIQRSTFSFIRQWPIDVLSAESVPQTLGCSSLGTKVKSDMEWLHAAETIIHSSLKWYSLLKDAFGSLKF